MCKISKETIFRANKMTMERRNAPSYSTASVRGMEIAIEHNGALFSRYITSSELRDNYRKALEINRR